MTVRTFSHTIILIFCIFSISCHIKSFAEENPASNAELEIMSEIDSEVSEIAIDSSDANITNTDIEVNAYASSSNKLTDNIDELDLGSSTEEEDLKFAKIDPLEPALLIKGKFNNSSSRKKKVELKGRIILERHPVRKRRYVYRWTLKLQDGSRIPLKSNLTLLQKVKDDDVLDGFVSIKGTWLISPSNENLRFFKIDSMRVIDEPILVDTESESINTKERNKTNDKKDVSDIDEKTETAETTYASETREIINTAIVDNSVTEDINDSVTTSLSVGKAIESSEPIETDETIESKKSFDPESAL